MNENYSEELKSILEAAQQQAVMRYHQELSTAHVLFLCAAAILSISAVFSDLTGTAADAIGKIRCFSETVEPIMIGLLTAMGCAKTAKLMNPMLVFLINGIVYVIEKIVLPMLLAAGVLKAVQSGVPYIGYTSKAVDAVNKALVSVGIDFTDGMDCLGYVTYPEKTLTNASYINDGDDVLYGYGTAYFTALPAGSKVLVQHDGSKEPLEGFLNGDEASYKAFLNGIQGFSYQGKDNNGNDIDITLFANSLTNKAHQRDEYAFISNTIFASLLEGKASFGSDSACTRAQAVTALWQATGSPAPQSAAIPFTDVSSGDSSYNAVLWAAEKGITKGTAPTTFAPDNILRRAFREIRRFVFLGTDIYQRPHLQSHLTALRLALGIEAAQQLHIKREIHKHLVAAAPFALQSTT